MAHITAPYTNGVRDLKKLLIALWVLISAFMIWNHSGMLGLFYILPTAWLLFKVSRVSPKMALYQLIYALIIFNGLWNHNFAVVVFGIMLIGLKWLFSKIR